MEDLTGLLQNDIHVEVVVCTTSGVRRHTFFQVDVTFGDNKKAE